MRRSGMVEVAGLSKRYPVRTRRDWLLARLARRGIQPRRSERGWALRDVSFRVPAGGSLAIVGANGAGKSTLVRILAGISLPTAGTVQVEGRLLTQSGLGVSFNPYLTGRENVFLEGTLLGMTNRQVRERLDRILAFAELGEAIDRPLWSWSTGMIGRLGFAVATVVESDILILDEALTATDAPFRVRCEAMLEEARAAGRTLIIVSHGMSTLRRLCDEALWLDSGTVRRFGPAGSVIDAWEVAAETGHLGRAEVAS